VSTLLTKGQIDENLNGRRDLLIIRQFDRHGLTLTDHRNPVRRHDARFLRKLAFTGTPAVHQADTRTHRLIRGLNQTVEDTDQHELPVPFLSNVIAHYTRLQIRYHTRSPSCGWRPVYRFRPTA